MSEDNNFAKLTETLESRRGCVLDDGILHNMLIHAKNYEELIALQIAFIKKIEAIAETKTAEAFAKLSEKEIRQSFALSIIESERRKKAEQRVAELQAALATKPELEKDAARYRWLCENKYVPWSKIVGFYFDADTGIDQAIDQAMKGETS